MLTVMRNPALPLQLRIDAAKKALPFCHPKLAPIQPPGAKVDTGLGARLEAATKRLAEQEARAIAKFSSAFLEKKQTYYAQPEHFC